VNESYVHLTVNYKTNFVDSESGIHTHATYQMLLA